MITGTMVHPKDIIHTKKFSLKISNQLPNGTYVTLEFGTETTEEGVDSEELFSMVYASTMEDIKKTVGKNPAAKSCWDKMVAGLKQEKKLLQSDKEFEEG